MRSGRQAWRRCAGLRERACHRAASRPRLFAKKGVATLKRRLMMLDLIGAVFGMMAIAINLVAMASVLPLSFRQRLVLAGGAGAWVGLASGLAAAGALTFSPGQPVPLIGLFAAAPLIAAAVSWFLGPGFRDALMAIPTPLLIRLNSLRLIGALFLVLATVGRLSGPIPLFRRHRRRDHRNSGDPGRQGGGARRRARRRMERLWRARSLRGDRSRADVRAGKPAPSHRCRRRFAGDAVFAVLPRADRARAVLSDHARRRGGAACPAKATAANL